MRKLLSRRPSAPLAISLVALFMSVGGVGYAAVSLPRDSVGNAQLRNDAVTYKKIAPNTVGKVRLADNGVTNDKVRNGAVTYKKIQPRAVGKVRANLDQLQARLAGTCPAGSAIGAVTNAGAVSCNRPAQTGAADKTVDVDSSGTAITSVALPTGASYLAFANPAVTVTGAGSVTVTCTLNVGGTTESRGATLAAPTAATVSLPLQAAGPAGTATVSCSAAGASSASGTSAINTLATS
jgi:hypothetical protein